jgi:hypothetical protein
MLYFFKICTLWLGVVTSPESQHSLVISSLRRLRQEDHQFEASLLYKVKPCLKIPRRRNVAQLWNTCAAYTRPWVFISKINKYNLYTVYLSKHYFISMKATL